MLTASNGVCLPTLALIARAVFLLQHGQTQTLAAWRRGSVVCHTNEVTQR